MSNHDLQIKNGRILKNDDLVESDVFITAGKISSIEKVSSSKASRSINAEGLILLPGLIDSHVHFRDPGATYKEDFLSGTRGAVAGGTTMVFDMPNTDPAVTSAEIFRGKAAVVGGKAICNFGLIAAASHENLSHFGELKKAGAIAFKTYMIAPPKDREKEYAGSFVTNSGQLIQTMKGVSSTGLVHCVHAESDSSVAYLTGEIKLQSRTEAMAHYDSRPNFTEEEAVSDALILSKFLHGRIHIVHVSTAQSAKLLSEAKQIGVDVTSETCPQYMLFSKEILDKKGPYAKFNPPPRNPEDQEAMIGGLVNSTIDMVSTDHAPHANSEKQLGFGNIFLAPSGTPGVETRLPLLLNLVHQGRMSLIDIPRITSTAAAKRFGIFPSKGAIEVGSDADISVVDFRQSWIIRASELQTKAWETVLYDGMEVKGRVKFTVVNGQIAYEDGSGFAKPGIGKMTTPSSH